MVKCLSHETGFSHHSGCCALKSIQQHRQPAAAVAALHTHPAAAILLLHVPGHRGSLPLLEAVAWLLAQLGADAAGIDGVTVVVAGAVAYPGDQLAVGGASGQQGIEAVQIASPSPGDWCAPHGSPTQVAAA